MSKGLSAEQSRVLEDLRERKIMSVLDIRRSMAKRRGADLYDIFSHRPSDPEMVPTYRMMRSLERRGLVGSILDFRPRHYVLIEDGKISGEAIKKLPASVILSRKMRVRTKGQTLLYEWPKKKVRGKA